jgi:ArsR family transcriptional regulator
VNCSLFATTFTNKEQFDNFRIVVYNGWVDHKDKVAMFKALGDPTRLRIFEFLCNCCCPVAVDEGDEVRDGDGPTVGEVCGCISGSVKVSSTMSFHLKELRTAGLITMERRGKNMVCGVQREVLANLSHYFDNSCDDRGNLPQRRNQTMENQTCCCGPDCRCGDGCTCKG